MDPRQLSQYIPKFAGAGPGLIGFYHSHPHSEPIPSRTDQQQAWLDQAVIHLIVGLKHAEPRMAVWRFDHGRVFPVEIHIGEHPPNIEQSSLSNAQKASIIVSAAIALALLLAISLYLLPPAPPIPS